MKQHCKGIGCFVTVCKLFSLIHSLYAVLFLFAEGLAVGVGFGAIGKSKAATFESARWDEISSVHSCTYTLYMHASAHTLPHGHGWLGIKNQLFIYLSIPHARTHLLTHSHKHTHTHIKINRIVKRQINKRVTICSKFCAKHLLLLWLLSILLS